MSLRDRRILVNSLLEGGASVGVDPNFTDFDGEHPNELIDRLIERTPEQGRQGSGYLKYDLKYLYQAGNNNFVLNDIVAKALSALPRHTDDWDLWLLYYPVGSSIPEHTDPSPIPGKRHIRFNVMARIPPYGGEFVVDGQPLEPDVGSCVIFRPDISPHSVNEIIKRSRVVISVGALI